MLRVKVVAVCILCRFSHYSDHSPQWLHVIYRIRLFLLVGSWLAYFEDTKLSDCSCFIRVGFLTGLFNQSFASIVLTSLTRSDLCISD